MNIQPTRTDELSILESQRFVDLSALAANLAGVSGIHLDQSRTACYSFVFEQSGELIPRSVIDVFSETMILNHSFDVQVLDSDKGISLSEGMTQLMCEVEPLIVDFQISSTESQSCFASVPASLLLSADSPMQELQSLVTSNEVTMIRNDCFVAESSEGFQTDINTNWLTSVNRNFEIDFTAERSEPLVSSVALDGQGLNLAFGNSMELDCDASDSRAFQPSVAEKLETALRVSYALNPALESRETFFPNGLVFDSSEEVIESLACPVAHVLQDLRVNCFFDFGIASLQVPDDSSELELISDKSFLVEDEGFIVDFLADLEIVEKSGLLNIRRIDSIFECSTELHINGINMNDYLNIMGGVG